MEKERDWSMPQTGEWSSLWECLHDASIKRVTFDPLSRELTLDLELGFPAPPKAFPGRVQTKLIEVTHLLIFVMQECPSGHPEHSPTMTPAEWQLVQQEYQSKSAAVTTDFDDFARLCSAEDVEIIEAEWSDDNAQVALDVQGYAKRYSWYRLLTSGKTLEIVAGGKLVSMGELLRVGRSGWEAWKRGQ